MNKPNILIFLSDQHNALFSGFAGNKIVRTPNLDKLAANGTVFDSAYTACPLCVPARISFLTGQMVSTTGAFDNRCSIHGDQATFIHSLAAEGYETVLCGRMHFMGEDQRHGFTKRIMGDITPAHLGIGQEWQNELGVYHDTVSVRRCVDVVGGGNSPVLEYDRAVIKAALEYLACDHEKPQCIVIGTYGPHFTYVAPPELYRYYRGIVEPPAANGKVENYESSPMVKSKEKHLEEEKILNIRAAYFGMIENIDMQVGLVRKEWEQYLIRNNEEGIFIYTSDHGDCAGEHNIYGKKVFYEGSARIPLIMEGCNIKSNNRIKGAASIIDIGVTICELVGAATFPNILSEDDGKSLIRQVTTGEEELERHITVEFVEKDDKGRVIPGKMIRKGKWKFIKYPFYEEYNILFDLESDGDELLNVIDKYPDKAEELRELLDKNMEMSRIEQVYNKKSEHFNILKKWGQAVHVEDRERWKVTAEAKQMPEII